MPQNWQNIAATTRLQDSLTPILDRDEAARSCYSGTSFPSTDLVLGMLCYRTDQSPNRLYQLKQITPVVIWEPIIDQQAGDARYLTLSGGTVVGNVTFDATGVERNLIFTTSALGGRRMWFFGRPSDEGFGLHSERNAKNVFLYTPATDTFDFGTVVLTRNGQPIWHQGNDGAGSGLDADLLDGQDGSFYLAWSNITGRPVFQDAAFTTVAAIQAGVNLASRVAKSGDTMTGALTFAVNIWNGSADGMPRFFFASSSHSYYRSWNQHIFRSGGDTNIVTIDAAGSIHTATYGWLHDRFATRWTALGQGGTRFEGNCGNIVSGGGYEVFDVGDGRHQVRYYQVNCTNCNCNCDCVGCACVFEGTKVRMADGSEKAVESLKPGDMVADGFGGANEVVGLHQTILGTRMGVRINGVSCTADHPVHSRLGWRSVDVAGLLDYPEVKDRMAGGVVLISSYDALKDVAMLQDLLPGDFVTADGGDHVRVDVHYLSAAYDQKVYSPIVRPRQVASFVAGSIIHGALRLLELPVQPVAKE